jgi:hypothetical protein
MISLKKLKMKKVYNLLDTKKKVERARNALEEKTEEAFQEFARNRRKAHRLAHIIVVD